MIKKAKKFKEGKKEINIGKFQKDIRISFVDQQVEENYASDDMKPSSSTNNNNIKNSDSSKHRVSSDQLKL